MQPQIDAAHANDAVTLATLAVCDHNGHILCDADGVSLALHACYYGHTALAQLIAARCRTLDLYSAAALNNVAQLSKHLLQHPDVVHAIAGDGFHALGLACFFAAPDTVRLCIAHGADVNRHSLNHFNVAPIHSAAAADRLDIVQMLLDAGANVNCAQHNGFCALHTAAQHGNHAMCMVLLSYGADRAAQTVSGQTARDIAVAHQHTQLLSIL